MVRLDWRSAMVYVHRWLGIAGCLLFVVWFASGIVMMYARMPSLSAEERLARLAPLDLTAARVEPEAAVAAAGFEPQTFRLGMLRGRPVYQLSAGRRWTTVYADTGERLAQLPADATSEVARSFLPEHAATLRHDARLDDSDQWTLSSAIRPLMPLDRFVVGDPEGSVLYVSARTGEPVMKTTRRERVWGYLGAVMHWLYFTPLRRQTGLWVEVVIWLSIAGTVMCVSGLAWGLWRFSPSARFRLKRVAAHSPYAGVMKWHHYAGLVFGATTCTWIFSGLMSMTPWDWSPGRTPTPVQRDAATGGPLRASLVSLNRVRLAQAAFASAYRPKELEVGQFRGEPFVAAYRPPAQAQAVEWANTDLPAFVEATTLERRLVSLATPERGTFTRFDASAVEAVVRDAMPGVRLVDAVWLDRYDDYYYDRSNLRPLPVLRARYADAVDTWLYLDPFKGAVVQKEERRSRAERWLYHGLHSLDFPFLYSRRPLWDIVLVVLSLGGLASAVTPMAPAWRRLRGHARRLSRRPAGAERLPVDRDVPAASR